MNNIQAKKCIIKNQSEQKINTKLNFSDASEDCPNSGIYDQICYCVGPGAD